MIDYADANEIQRNGLFSRLFCKLVSMQSLQGDPG